MPLLPLSRLIRRRCDVVVFQAGFDVWSWGEGRHDVTKDVALGADVFENFLQVLLFAVGCLEVDVLVLLGNHEDVDDEAVTDSIEDALPNAFLDAVEPVVDEFQLDGDAVVIDGQVWAVLLPEAVDALHDGFHGHLADDFALETVLIRTDYLAEQHFEVPFGLAREVEAGTLHDSIDGVHVIPAVAPPPTNFKTHGALPYRASLCSQQQDSTSLKRGIFSSAERCG